MISCVLLSAGYSSRFGSPKALAKIGNVPIIEHVLTRLLKTSLSHILVVLGADADQIRPHVLEHKKISIVYNKDYNLGQTSSFKTALLSLPSKISGIMLLPIDYPFIRSATVDDLVTEFNSKNPYILIPTYQSRKGHPPIFSASLREEFLSLDDGLGVNQVVHQHEVLLYPVKDEGVISTFNTQPEFDLLLPKFI